MASEYSTIAHVCVECGKTFFPRKSSVASSGGKFCTLSCYHNNKAGPLPHVRYWQDVIVKADGCWDWSGSRFGNGYAALFARTLRRYIGAHRVSWELHYGPITDGLFVCHKCDNRICTRPDHLFLGTHADNMQDRDNKGRNTKGRKMDPSKIVRGEKHYLTKLTDDSVREIRALKQAGMSTKEIAAKFQVATSVVYTVIWRRTWAHI